MTRTDDSRRSVVRRAWLLAALAALAGLQLGRHGARPGPRTALIVAAAVAAAFLLARALARLTPSPPPPSPGSGPPGRRLLFAGLALVVTWLGMEALLAGAVAAAPAALHGFGLMREGDGPQLRGWESFERFLATGFDPYLGWDNPEIPGWGHARPSPLPYPTALVSAYGDSFTQCTGPYEETWETHLGRLLGTNVPNYGVGAFGPDQSLLKLERDLACHPTRIVLFGYLSENINRLYNVYRFAFTNQFYDNLFHPDGSAIWEPTKPRFELRDGRLELLPNPVQGEADLWRLLGDPSFREAFAAHDRFRRGYRLENVCPKVGFPYLVTIPRGALERVRRAREPRTDPAAELLRDPGTFALLGAVLDRFFERTRQAGSLGIVTLWGWPEDLEAFRATRRHPRLDPVIRFLESRGYPYIDTVALLADHLDGLSEPLSSALLFEGTRHHSAYAHRVIAEAMAARLRPYVPVTP